MSEGQVKEEVQERQRFTDEQFAKIVRENASNGSGIDGIVKATGLQRSSVNTRLANLRKLVGKENVPSFQGGRRKKNVNKDELIAILQGTETQS